MWIMWWWSHGPDMHFPPLAMVLTLHVLSLQLFSIVVFATITAEGYTNPTTKEETKCMFNGSDGACSYGVGIGILAFLACVAFIILDAYFPQISNAKERKCIVIGDLVFSGESWKRNKNRKCSPSEVHLVYIFDPNHELFFLLWHSHFGTATWTFLWFICFCVLASLWSHTPASIITSSDAARAVLAFSFFSIITWVSWSLLHMLQHFTNKYHMIAHTLAEHEHFSRQWSKSSIY